MTFLFYKDIRYNTSKEETLVEIFRDLPLSKRSSMEALFQNCTEEVKYYMSVVDVEAGRTFVRAGEECTSIFIILSGKVMGVEWPVHEQQYSFRDFGPGDFFGEIECFAGLRKYRVSILTSTNCRILSIPAFCYMDWMHNDVDALYTRTQENMRRLLTQTVEARKYLFMDGKERLMFYLIRKYEQKQPLPERFDLKQTRSQIAEEIGFSVKTLDRSIKKLQEMELLQLVKGKIRIEKEGYLQMKEHTKNGMDV